MNSIEKSAFFSMKFYQSDVDELQMILEIGKLLGRDFPNIERMHEVIDHNLNCDGTCTYSLNYNRENN